MALAGLTQRGRALLAAGVTSAAAGVVVDQQDLVRVGVLLLALPVVAALFLTRARYRISAERRVESSRVALGNVVRVELRIRNLSRLSTPLLLAQDALPPELGAPTDGGARFVLDRISPGGERSVTYAVRPTQRGRFSIGPLSVRLADPFGFCQIQRSFSSVDQLRVLPEVTPLPSGRLGGQWTEGADGRQRGISTTGEQDATTRPYVAGDDRRRVHWRTTARTGELSVRREEQPWQSKATVLIDTREDAHSPGFPSASFELAVSAAASFARALTRSGYGLRLVDDIGRILGDTARLPVDGGIAIVDGLADLDTGVGTTLLPVSQLLGDVMSERSSIVAVLGRVTPGDVSALERAGRRSGHALALLIDADAWTPGVLPGSSGAETGAELLRRAGWSVAVARPPVSLRALWQELNAVNPHHTRRWVG